MFQKKSNSVSVELQVWAQQWMTDQSPPPSLIHMSRFEGEKGELIDALYDAIPPDFKLLMGHHASEFRRIREHVVATFNDNSDDETIIEWYERAMMGVKLTENPQQDGA